MALRKVASELVTGLGVRVAIPQTTTSGSSTLMALSSSVMKRGFATVMDGFKYAKSHEYVNMDGDIATVGISDFAQSELGDVVYVELPEVGSELTKGETFGVVESVKAASDVYAPVSGEVIEVNETLADDPSKVNSEPFEGGWMMKVKVTGGGEDLLDSKAYEAHCEAGGH